LKEQVTEEFKNKFPEIDEIVLQLLYDRQLDSQEKIDEFLNPDYSQDIHDPFLFQDMPAAVERVYQAIEKKEKITVHGDYDADGVSGSAILVSSLKRLGADVDVYIPHREKDGYGINAKTVEFLHQQKTDLIITTDCGISNKAEIDKAQDLGMEVIVTDHHHIPPEIPDCLIINPQLETDNYPFKYLAGSGVAFKLVQGLLKRKKDADDSLDWEAFEKWLLDLVALGTVADLMPVLGENRTLIKYGLVVLNKTKRVGLKKLLELAGLNYNSLLNTYNLAFQIGPRINAAGRVDHASTAYQLLLTDNQSEANQLADQLEKNNKDRQVLTERIINEAKQQIEPFNKEQKLIFVYGEDWPLGVVGLVAGRLSQEYHRPAFALGQSQGQISGSGRSIPEFDCIESLEKINHLFARYGGHAAACGFTLAKNDELARLKTELSQIAEKELAGKDLKPRLVIDAEIKFSSVNWDLIEELSKFEPYGQKNPRPVFASYQVKVVGLETVGQDNQHLKLILTQDNGIVRKAIGFCFGDWCSKIKAGDLIDIVYSVEINEWNGNREIQLKLEDLKLSH